MNIGIYKPAKKICFQEDLLDHAGWSSEIIPIIKILANAGHKVHIISPTDYIPGSIENVSNKVLPHYDKIFLFNGKMDNTDVLGYLNSVTTELNLIATDLALIPDDLSQFDNIYSQSKRFHTYGHIEEGLLYDYNPEINKKNIMFSFGGTERNRLDDIIEYIYRPECYWYGKSTFFDKLDYIPYHEHLDIVRRTKCTIIIGDKEYNKIGFVTPRYYEALKYDVIAFVDRKYDPDCLLISKDDFRRVSSFKELYKKIEMLNANKKIYDDLTIYQRNEITRDKTKGRNILKSLC